MIFILSKSLLKVKYLELCKGGQRFQSNVIIELKSPCQIAVKRMGSRFCLTYLCFYYPLN